MQRSTVIVVLASILVLAASLRLGPVLSNVEQRRKGLGPYGDPDLYHVLALNLVAGRGFTRGGQPVIFRSPGYPLVLAAVYAAVGAGDATTPEGWKTAWTAVRVVQSLMDCSLCLAVFLILLSAFPGREWIALLGAFLQSVDPYTAFWARTLLTEPLTSFLLLWCLAFLGVGMRKRWLAAFAASGILGGALVLTRPEYLPWLALALLPVLLMPSTKWARRIGSALLAAACSILVIAPWTYRNVCLFHRLIPVATGSVGELLYRGTFEGSNPWRGWTWIPSDYAPTPAEKEEMAGLYAAYIRAQSTAGPEIFPIDEAFTKKALARIGAWPAETARAWFSNIPRLWYQRYIQMFQDREPPGVYVMAALIAAAAGLVLAGRQRRFLFAAAGVPLFLTLLYLPFHVESRYSTPAMPVLAALAAAGIACALAAAARALRAVYGAATVDEKDGS